MMGECHGSNNNMAAVEQNMASQCHLSNNNMTNQCGGSNNNVTTKNHGSNINMTPKNHGSNINDGSVSWVEQYGSC